MDKPRKRRPQTDVERKRAQRERLKAQGLRQLNLVVTADEEAALRSMLARLRA